MDICIPSVLSPYFLISGASFFYLTQTLLNLVLPISSPPPLPCSFSLLNRRVRSVLCFGQSFPMLTGVIPPTLNLVTPSLRSGFSFYSSDHLKSPEGHLQPSLRIEPEESFPTSPRPLIALCLNPVS